IALLAPWPAIAICGFALVGLGLSNLVPVIFNASARIAGLPGGTGIAAVASMGYVGLLAGPPVIGGIAEATNLTLALGTALVACIVIGIAAGSVAVALGRDRATLA